MLPCRNKITFVSQFRIAPFPLALRLLALIPHNTLCRSPQYNATCRCAYPDAPSVENCYRLYPLLLKPFEVPPPRKNFLSRYTISRHSTTSALRAVGRGKNTVCPNLQDKFHHLLRAFWMSSVRLNSFESDFSIVFLPFTFRHVAIFAILRTCKRFLHLTVLLQVTSEVARSFVSIRIFWTGIP